MEETSTRSLHVESIRGALNRIMDEWLLLHLHLTVALVVVAFLVEIFLAFFIVNSEIMTSTLGQYVIKYIATPNGLSTLLVLVAFFTVRTKRLSREAKTYIVSLLFVLICFIYYTVHSAFVATYALYAFSIFLTTTYANYRLTGLTSLLSIATFVVSELYLRWDVDKVSVFTDPNRLMEFLVALSVIIGYSIVAIVTIHYERRKNEASLRREVERELMKESLLFDELTGVYNRKALHDALRLLEETAPTEPHVFCIADLDHFKSINDLYGHQMGDICLTEFSCVLCEYLGESAVFRYGGDEFCMIMKNTTAAEAVKRCEQVQSRLRRVSLHGVPELKIFVSFGLTQYDPGDTASSLFRQADSALYEAKSVRNATRVFHRASVSPIMYFRISSQEDIT
jgi:diguanylate cyclase (GGDEF)-like protein